MIDLYKNICNKHQLDNLSKSEKETVIANVIDTMKKTVSNHYKFKIKYLQDVNCFQSLLEPIFFSFF